MHRILIYLLLVLFVPAACGDDSTPSSDQGHVGDGAVALDDATVLPWPDWPAFEDSQAQSCTAGESGMCNDIKRQYCSAGTCAACPADRVDCDRTGDCECIGACNGTKCAGSK